MTGRREIFRTRTARAWRRSTRTVSVAAAVVAAAGGLAAVLGTPAVAMADSFCGNGFQLAGGGALEAKYIASGGPGGSLGCPLSNETTVPTGPDGGGHYAFFAHHAAIFWKSTTGAHVVKGSILDSYFSRGSNVSGWVFGILVPGQALWQPDPSLGFPIAEQRVAENSPNVGTGPGQVPGDVYSDFENGVLVANGVTGDVTQESDYAIPDSFVLSSVKSVMASLPASCQSSEFVLGTPQLGAPGQGVATDYSTDATTTHNRKYVVSMPLRINPPNPFPGFDSRVTFNVEPGFVPQYVAGPTAATTTEGRLTFNVSNFQVDLSNEPAVDKFAATFLSGLNSIFNYLTFFYTFGTNSSGSGLSSFVPPGCVSSLTAGGGATPMTLPGTSQVPVLGSFNLSTESVKLMPNGDLDLFTDLLPNAQITAPATASTAPALLGASSVGGLVFEPSGTNVVFNGGDSFISSTLVATGVGTLLGKNATVTPSSASTCCTDVWSSNADGVMGTGPSIGYVFRTPGLRTVTLSTIDSFGLSSDATILVLVFGVPPDVSISAPPDGSTVDAGATTELTGSATQPGFFGNLPCSSLVWTSSNAADTQFPLTGCDEFTTFTTAGSRTLTLSATNGLGAVGTATVTINVVTLPPDAPPVVTITRVPPGGLNAGSFPVSGKAFDPGGNAIASWSWTVSVNGGPPQQFATTPNANWTMTGGCQQDDVFTLSATDTAGRSGSAHSSPVQFVCPPR